MLSCPIMLSRGCVLGVKCWKDVETFTTRSQFAHINYSRLAAELTVMIGTIGSRQKGKSPARFRSIFRNFRKRLIVTAGVIGFGETELSVSIDPQRVIVAGKKETVSEEGNKVVYIDWEPNEILCSIELPAPVVPNDAKVRLQDGWLHFELPLREGSGSSSARIDRNSDDDQ